MRGGHSACISVVSVDSVLYEVLVEQVDCAFESYSVKLVHAAIRLRKKTSVLTIQRENGVAVARITLIRRVEGEEGREKIIVSARFEGPIASARHLSVRCETE